MTRLPSRIASVSMCHMSDETGPKLTVEAIEKKLARPPRGRKPRLTEAEQRVVADEYFADENVSMRSLATKHGVTLSVVRRAVHRVAAKVQLENLRRNR